MGLGFKGKAMALLALLLCMLVLVSACSSARQHSNEGANSGESTTSARSDESDRANAEQPKTVNKIYIYQNQGKPADTSKPEAVEEIRQYIIDQVGVEPVIIVAPKGTEKEKLNLMLSADEKVDLFGGPISEYKELIMPITDLLNEHGQDILKAWSKEAWAQVTDENGEIWGIPRLVPVALLPVWVRQDLLDKYSLPMPATLEELENVMQVFKDNGHVPLLAQNNWYRGIFNAFAGGFTEHGFSNWVDPTDNRVKIAELQPGFADFLAKMAEWYQKGYIPKDAFGAFDGDALFRTGNVGIVADWYSQVTITQPQLKETFPDMSYVVAKDLKGPKGSFQTVFRGGDGGYLISKKAEHPEDIIKFINWQFQNIENYLTVDIGMKGKAWQWADEANAVLEQIGDKTAYFGDFNTSMGLANETRYRTIDPLMKMHMDYIKDELLNYSNAKLPFDYTFVYDQAARAEQVPTIADLDRLRNEEAVKFIMGARPLSEFDQYIEELKKAGLEQYQNFMTSQHSGT